MIEVITLVTKVIELTTAIITLVIVIKKIK